MKKGEREEDKNPIVEVASTFVSAPEYQRSVEQLGFGELMHDTYDNPGDKNKKDEKDT
ncbi:MAG: hypothetical protein Q8930_10120 [Bacillota bacterium]|nr:hypothetical protein [Bacillota bacterium]